MPAGSSRLSASQQRGERAARREQRRRWARLHQPALVEDRDEVRVLGQPQPVRDDDHRARAAPGRPIAATMTSSASGSRCAVGSSRTRNGDVAQERARDRDPLPLAAAQAHAAFADGRVVCPRAARRRARPRRPRGRPRQLRPSVASGRASRRLSATVPWNRCGAWGTQPTPARHAAGSIEASWRPPTVIRPVVGLDEPQQQPCQRSSCPAPVAPTIATRRPGRRRRGRGPRARPAPRPG